MSGEVRRLAICGTLVGLWLGPGILPAQEAGSELRPGDRIRVYRVTEPTRAMTGKFVTRDGADLQMVSDSAGAAIRIPFAEVRRLERLAGTHGHTLVGLGIGAGIGLSLGVAGAAGEKQSDFFYVSPGAVVAGSLLFGGAAGALVGTLVRSDEWAEVPLATVPSAPQPVPPVAPDSTGPIAAER